MEKSTDYPAGSLERKILESLEAYDPVLREIILRELELWADEGSLGISPVMAVDRIMRAIKLADGGPEE